MRNVTLKNLASHKLRLALTSLAIVLGVTFVSGTFVLTDTLHGLFSSLVGTMYQKIDFQVRGVAQFPTADAASAVRNPLPESLLQIVRRVPGVEAASGEVTGYAEFLTRNGTPIANGGAPTLGMNFDPNQQISELHLTQGTAPSSPSDVVMDAGTASKYHFAVGQHVRVLGSGSSPGTYTISGIARFGTAGNLAGATLAAFTLPEAQQMLDAVGHFDTINIVTTPGANKAAVQQGIARVLPKGVQVVTGQTVANEETASINQSLSFLSTALEVFALIALVVGAFTIYNTFSITVGQRTRELALLRVVGASRRQVLRSVLAEAGLVGLVSSLTGVGLGVLAAGALEALLRGFGVTLPSGPLVFEPRTLLVGLLVGVGVTVVSAIGPARRAVGIAPVTAITGDTGTAELPTRARLARGGGVFAFGALLLEIGLSVPVVPVVGIGALFIFGGTVMLAPALARPVASVLGRPLARLSGPPGRLGRANAMRSPRRTSQTAAALMVGLAVVGAMATFGASVSRSATASVDGAINADLLVTGKSNGSGSFSPTLASAVARVPGVTSSLTVYGGQFEVRGSVATLKAVPVDGLAQTVALHLTSGSVSDLANGELLIDSSTASSDHLHVGSRVPVRFALTGASTMRIGGIYQSNALVGSYLVGETFYLSHYRNPLPSAVLLKTGGGSATERIQQAVRRELASSPTVQVQARAQFESSELSSINQLLGLVYVLLALAVLIAVIGIVNALMLSVFERTREIGLLRAVDMKRRQVRTMIRSESIVISIFGAIIGLVIGTGLGAALASSLELSEIAIPATSLVAFLVLSALLGLGAAAWPARRAARLDVLAAIAGQ